MAWKTCSYLVPCSSKKKKRKKKEELRLNRWTEHRDALSIKLWCYRWVYRVDPEKVCNRANKKIGSMITCAHGTRTKACHGQVYLCFLRRIWATRELTHVTIEKRLDDGQRNARETRRRSNSIQEQSFHFYSPSSRWNSTLSYAKSSKKGSDFYEYAWVLLEQFSRRRQSFEYWCKGNSILMGGFF